VRLSGTVETTTRAAGVVGLLKGVGAFATVGGTLLAVSGWTLHRGGFLVTGMLLFLVGLAMFVAGRVMQ